MRRVIIAIRSHLDECLNQLRVEWKEGNGGFKRLTHCWSYEDCKALVAAIHVLEKRHYGKKKTLSVKELLNS
ncbi:hypothetical protein PaecuDRAFT_3143 [Paenibacillus curdlanolyticus YK9]|uniref:Uncharacterized protein n=1 Tax=Paenibacillus curdlanolyticus YK9 TaxID=717606 RepID=E0IBV4_9BACL|nr:hypothetical protein PaecuDRAFT_3143 [Paenibacillus curdlanolyticus YK9]